MLVFRGVCIVPTNVCDLRCRHCYADGGDVHRFGDNIITPVKQVERYLRQIPQLKNVGKSVHFAGGEITLFRDECGAMIRCARGYGLEVTLVTNGSWARSQRHADAFVKRMRSCGLNSLQISMSGFHREFRPLDCVVRAIRACKRYNIGVLLRPTVTRSKRASDVIHDISSDDLYGTSFHVAKCIPTGRAKHMISADDFFYDENINESCYRCLILLIRQDGSVFPCCAGSDTTQSLCLGNANQESLSEIITRAELDPVLHILLHQGPKYIAGILREMGGKDFTRKRYVNICHLCYELFIDNETAGHIRQALSKHLRIRKRDFSKAHCTFVSSY